MISKNKIKYIRSLELKKNRNKEGKFVAEVQRVYILDMILGKISQSQEDKYSMIHLHEVLRAVKIRKGSVPYERIQRGQRAPDPLAVLYQEPVPQRLQ